MVKSEIEIEDKYLRSIGLIVVSFSALESAVSEWINSLLLTEGQLGEIVTAEMSFRAKVTLASSLCRYKFKDSKRLEKLDKLLRRLQQAECMRNDVVHSYWGFSTGEIRARRSKKTAKIKTGLRFHFQEMTVDELNEIADFIGNVVYDVVLFEGHMYDGEPWFETG